MKFTKYSHLNTLTSQEITDIQVCSSQYTNKPRNYRYSTALSVNQGKLLNLFFLIFQFSLITCNNIKVVCFHVFNRLRSFKIIQSTTSNFSACAIFLNFVELFLSYSRSSSDAPTSIHQPVSPTLSKDFSRVSLKNTQKMNKTNIIKQDA